MKNVFAYQVAGNLFPSIASVANTFNLAETTIRDNLKKSSTVVIKGVTIKRVIITDDELSKLRPTAAPGAVAKAMTQEDPLLATLRERYSPEELQAIAAGINPLKEKIDFPKPSFTGQHFRIGVIGDTHIGSIYTSDEYITQAFDTFKERGVDFMVHCGDVTEGLSPKRRDSQIYELVDLGYAAQKQHAIDLFRTTDIPIFAIAGNHDLYYKATAGANIVQAIAAEVKHFNYIGDHEADINCAGAKLRLWHGNDGNSYALSYRLQKLIESYSGGDKPNILLAGHTHKFVYIFERNIHALSPGCLQKQTQFMRTNRLAAHVAFAIIEFDVHDGLVSNFKVENYPFYA